MMLAERFRAHVTDAFTRGAATIDLLPMVFVRAAVSVLPIDGAGLSMTNHLRVPLAASDEDVVAAERLQTTLGEGPCLTAVAAGEPLVVNLAGMAARWPVFRERFGAECPYQSVASFPLGAAQASYVGALDLYSSSSVMMTSRQVEDIDAGVAIPIASMLFGVAGAAESDGGAVPGWLTQDSVGERMNVWVAVGMSMERLKLSNGDALALLRGYAYSHDLTLDEVSRRVTDTGLQPEDLLV